VKNFSNEYVSELEARYNSCSHPNSAKQPSITRAPDENAPGGPLMRVLKWYDQYMTYRLVLEETPETLFLVDPETRQIENLEVVATMLTPRLLARLITVTDTRTLSTSAE
jgi:hypothetical protein